MSVVMIRCVGSFAPHRDETYTGKTFVMSHVEPRGVFRESRRKNTEKALFSASLKVACMLYGLIEGRVAGKMAED